MILIWSEESDATTEDVMDWLEWLGAEHRRINGEDLDGGAALELRLDAEAGPVWVDRGGFHPGEVDVIWHRRWNHTRAYARTPLLNTLARSRSPNLVELASAFHLARELTALTGCVSASLANARRLGDLAQARLNKLLVLSAAARAGLSVPSTLITTERNAVERFVVEHGSIVVKPMSDVVTFYFAGEAYFMYTAACGPEEVRQWPEHFFPTLFQEHLAKEYDVRVFYLDGACYAMAIFSQAERRTAADFRRYDPRRPTRFVPYSLAPELEQRLTGLMQTLGLDTGSIDLVRTVDGRDVFLEVNPNGQFGMVSGPCNYGLERRIAEHLVALARRRADG